MKLNMFLFTALLLCLVNIELIHSHDMDSRSPISVSAPPSAFSSGTLKSHSGISYSVNRNKTVILSAPYGYGMLAAFRFLDLRPNNQDYLTLFDNKNLAFPVKYSNPFSYRRKERSSSEDYYTFYAPSGQLGVTFTTGPYFTSIGYDGFQLTFTAQGLRAGDCGYSFAFWCDNGRCISDDFKCDGHNNCGDRSDEKNCFSTGKKLGIGFGVTFLLIAIACGIYIYLRRGRVTRTEVRTVHSPPGPGNYYPPPPPYSTNQGYQ